MTRWLTRLLVALAVIGGLLGFGLWLYPDELKNGFGKILHPFSPSNTPNTASPANPAAPTQDALRTPTQSQIHTTTTVTRESESTAPDGFVPEVTSLERGRPEESTFNSETAPYPNREPDNPTGYQFIQQRNYGQAPSAGTGTDTSQKDQQLRAQPQAKPKPLPLTNPNLDEKKRALNTDGKIQALPPQQKEFKTAKINSAEGLSITNKNSPAKNQADVPPNVPGSSLAKEFGQGVGEGLIKGAIEELKGGGGASSSETGAPSSVVAPVGGQAPAGAGAKVDNIGESGRDLAQSGSGAETASPDLNVFQSCMKEFANTIEAKNRGDTGKHKDIQKQAQERCAVEQLLSK